MYFCADWLCGRLSSFQRPALPRPPTSMNLGGFMIRPTSCVLSRGSRIGKISGATIPPAMTIPSVVRVVRRLRGLDLRGLLDLRDVLLGRLGVRQVVLVPPSRTP